MDELDFELLQTKVLGAESQRQVLQGRTGHPPLGWSSARASARLIGDHAALPSGAGGARSTGGDRFGQCNGRLAFVLDRLEARVLRSGPPPKKTAAAPVATLHLYDLEDPVELLAQEEAAEDGPSVPFRLTEAKICNVATGENPYFGRVSIKVGKVSQSTVALFDGL